MKQQLIAARKLIEDPDRWLQRRYHDYSNKKFCLVGAMAAASMKNEIEIESSKMYRFVQSFVADRNQQRLFLHEFNDSHSHDEVLALLDKAIAKCEET